jgi:hypothetical protein
MVIAFAILRKQHDKNVMLFPWQKPAGSRKQGGGWFPGLSARISGAPAISAFPAYAAKRMSFASGSPAVSLQKTRHTVYFLFING